MATLSALPVPSQDRLATLGPHEGIALDEGMGCSEFQRLARDLDFEGTAAHDLLRTVKIGTLAPLQSMEMPSSANHLSQGHNPLLCRATLGLHRVQPALPGLRYLSPMGQGSGNGWQVSGGSGSESWSVHLQGHQ